MKLLEKIQYMPTEQRQYLFELKKKSKLRELVDVSENLDLREAYNDAVQALAKFRSEHIKIAGRFIVVPQTKVAKSDYESLKEEGTGGSNIIPFLKTIRDDTLDHMK